MSNKYYVTTAIAYPNAKPHLGFALELVQADVIARWRRQQGDSVIFATGTDEHGSKIYETALAAGQEPQAFVDAASTHFVEAAQVLNVQYDRFVRTSSSAHKAAARHLWQQLKKDLYKDTYKGPYCVGCENFVPPQEAKANQGNCPIHQRAYEILEEENYFFRLSKYADQIKAAITDERYQVLPASRKHEILGLLEQGLEDVSFSRPKAKLPWGVEVPDDPEHIMYVWPDALANYISILGYPEAPEFSAYWPANVHVIGKDILRFHAAIWPGILLSAGLELPKRLFVHGFMTLEGQKISKSLGNVVYPEDIVDQFGTDALRYYLLREIPASGDGDFSRQRFETVYNSDLADELGNLVQRVAAMVARYQQGAVGEIPPHGHDIARYEEALADFRFDRALAEVWEQVRGLNRYVDAEKPWEIAKAGDSEHLQEVLGYLVGSLRQVGTLLQPFLPATAKKILEIFGKERVASKAILFPKLEQE